MRVRYPAALDGVSGNVPSRVTVDGDNYDVDDDGVVELPSEYEADRLASAYGVDVSDIRVTDICDVVKNDGEVCGRELPCRFHSEDDE